MTLFAVNMSDRDEDLTALKWKRVKSKPKKRPSQASPEVQRKKNSLDNSSSTSANKFALLSDGLPDKTGNKYNKNEDLEMVIEDSASDSAKPPPIILSDVNDISEMLAYLNSKIKRERDGVKVLKNSEN